MGAGSTSRSRLEETFEAIDELRKHTKHSIKYLCAAAGVSRSGWYKWSSCEMTEAELDDERIIGLMRDIYVCTNGIYGYRRLAMALEREHGEHVGKKRIYRLARIAGLRSVIRRKRPNYIRSTPEITAENVLARDFRAEQVNEKWLTDVTEFKLDSGTKLYLSAILDRCDRSIVAYKIGTSNNNELVFSTFDEAVERNPDARPIFHSDRGFQYTNKIFKSKLDARGMTQSMSRVGRCLDNAPMEGFWGTLKSEMFYLKRSWKQDELISAIHEYMAWYNTQRGQASLGGLAPLEYRARRMGAQWHPASS